MANKVTFGAYDNFVDIGTDSADASQHQTVTSPDGLPSTIAVHHDILDEHNQRLNEFTGKDTVRTKQDLVDQHAQASFALQGAGISTRPDSGLLPVGVNARGTQLYANPKLANTNNPQAGMQVTKGVQNFFKPFGSLTPRDNTRLETLSATASDPTFIKQLDDARTKDSPQKFGAMISNRLQIGPSGDSTIMAAHENWTAMSDTQKALLLNNAVVSNFRDGAGKPLKDIKLTREIGGVPTLQAVHGLQLASEGENVPALARNWGQLANIHESVNSLNTVKDIATTAKAMNLVGVGNNNAAAVIDEQDISNLYGKHVPQYGIGALSVDAQATPPAGYVQAGTAEGRKIIIPKANFNSASVGSNPDTMTRNAAAVYSGWQKSKNNPATNGALGGNQTAGGIAALTAYNPYAASVAMLTPIIQKTPALNKADSADHLNAMVGDTHTILTKGAASTQGDSGFVNKFTLNRASYGSAMEEAKKKYAASGITSKQLGYMLANQSFAEGRISETQHVQALKSLDMVFDPDSYSLAERLATGVGKATEIAARRNANG